MPDWVIWIIGAAALVAGEVFTLGFILGPVALAALLAALVAAAGGGLGLQLAVFIVGSVASLAFVRPLATRHLRMPTHTRTGAAALVGSLGGGSSAFFSLSLYHLSRPAPFVIARNELEREA